MIGLDTNVLVRYLTQDDLAQAQQAHALIQAAKAQGQTCFISNVVLCELTWVLQRAYGVNRADLIQTLESILKTADFEFENPSLIYQALQRMRQGKADFADYLIGLTHLQVGCTETVSFDRKLQGETGFRSL